MKKCRRLESFTLIEMLVVITVIGVLVAMIVPAVVAAREKGRSVRCVSNLKQLATAALNYTLRDNDDKFDDLGLPDSKSSVWQDEDGNYHERVGWVDWTGHVWENGTPGLTYWWGANAYKSIASTNRGGNGTQTLWEYTGRNLKLYACPTFCQSSVAGSVDPDAKKPLTFNFSTTGNAVLRSYGMNKEVSRDRVGSSIPASRQLLFADMSHSNKLGGTTIANTSLRAASQAAIDDAGVPYDGWNWDGELAGYTNGGSVLECIGTYHGGRGNVVFADGHVESLLWSNTAAACSGNW